MSIFDAGFIVWGYLVLYVGITVAYYVWMAARNRRETRRDTASAHARDDVRGRREHG